MAVRMKFRFIPEITGEQNGCSSGTRSDKQTERKILHAYMDLVFNSPEPKAQDELL